MNPKHPSFYETAKMSMQQAWCRGFDQGQTGQGPFGIWRALEEDPTSYNALLVSKWLEGWAKGRTIYENRKN